MSTPSSIRLINASDRQGLGQAVRQARRERGWNQKALALLLGTTGSAVSRLERGHQPISLPTLEKLARQLDLTFLVGGQTVSRPFDDGGA